MPATVLGLDPSSTCIGYALLRGLRPADLVECGILRPHDVRGKPVDRIDSLVEELSQLIASFAPLDEIVLELTSGKQHGRIKGRAQGLGTLGVAGGAMLATCWRLHGHLCTHYVYDNEWTNRVPKARRQAGIAAAYGDRYDYAQDEGADAADAIGVARWWMQQQAFADRDGGGR